MLRTHVARLDGYAILEIRAIKLPTWQTRIILQNILQT